MFCAFHRAHTITAQASRSCWFSLVIIVRNNSKKSDTLFEHFLNSSSCHGPDIPSKGALPLSHSTWQGVSKCWEQISHLASTCTLRRCKLSFVGRIFEQALHRRVRTLGGTFSFHTFFQSLPFCCACECSPWDWFLRPRAIL